MRGAHATWHKQRTQKRAKRTTIATPSFSLSADTRVASCLAADGGGGTANLAVLCL
jgi:hypothetical protein